MDMKVTLPKQALEVLRNSTTGMVVDALAISGIKGGIMGVRPVRGSEDAKVVGPAVTALFTHPHPNSPKLNNYLVIRNSPPGSVLVLDGKGYDGHFTGDNQGECAKRQGLEAVIVYGGARDIAGYRQLGMPLYCMGSASRNMPSDLQLTAYNVPIDIGGVLVNPGDIIVADEDGVVAIPAQSLETTLRSLEIIFQVEKEMEQAIQREASVEDIMAVISKKKPKA